MKKKLLTALLSGLMFANMIPVAAAEIPIEEETGTIAVEEGSGDMQNVSVGGITESEEIPVDEAHFPGKKFQTYIGTIIDKNKDGMLSMEERADVTEIHLYDSDDMTNEDGDLYYDDMTGVEYFFNLTYLELAMPDSVQNVDFSKMPHLETLDIMDCSFQNLDLSQNLQLKQLYLGTYYSSARNVKNIQLAENNQIEEMELYDKGGVVESFEFLNSLHHAKRIVLSLQKDKEYSLDFSNNQNLESLSIESATLTAVNLTQNKALKSLSINADISCDTIDLSQNTNLTYGKLTTGSLSKLGFLDIENCDQNISMYTSQKMTLQKNEEGCYNLADIPGYNPERFVSVQGAEISGNKLYPEERYVTYTYYLDSRGKNKGTFTFDCGKQIQPSAIEGLKITNTTSTSITCKWNQCTDPYTGYVVYARNENNGKIDKRIKVKKGTVTCKITGLKAGGKYTVIVRAYRNYQGKNYYSVYYKGTRLIYTCPPTPILKVSGNSGGKVKLSWTSKSPASSSWKRGYLIYYRQKGSSSYTRLAVLSDTQKTYTTTKLKKGKTYYVKMRSYISSKETVENYYSDFTKPITITVK